MSDCIYTQAKKILTDSAGNYSQMLDDIVIRSAKAGGNISASDARWLLANGFAGRSAKIKMLAKLIYKHKGIV